MAKYDEMPAIWVTSLASLVVFISSSGRSGTGTDNKNKGLNPTNNKEQEVLFLPGSMQADLHPTAICNPCWVQGGDSRTHPEKDCHSRTLSICWTSWSQAWTTQIFRATILDHVHHNIYPSPSGILC